MFPKVQNKVHHLTNNLQCSKRSKNHKFYLNKLTAEGRTPPSAVYKDNFPTGIPIP